MRQLTLVDRAALVNGIPGQTMTTDRTTGKIFWVGMTSNNQIGITVFSRDTLANIGRMAVAAPIYEVPLRVVRPTSNSLAIVTWSGYLILVQGSLLEP